MRLHTITNMVNTIVEYAIILNVLFKDFLYDANIKKTYKSNIFFSNTLQLTITISNTSNNGTIILIGHFDMHIVAKNKNTIPIKKPAIRIFGKNSRIYDEYRTTQ